MSKFLEWFGNKLVEFQKPILAMALGNFIGTVIVALLRLLS